MVKSFFRIIIFRHMDQVSTRLFSSYFEVNGADTRLFCSYWYKNTSLVQFVKFHAKLRTSTVFRLNVCVCVCVWGGEIKLFCRNVIFRHMGPVASRLFSQSPHSYWCKNTSLCSYWCRNRSFVQFVENSCKISDINGFFSKMCGANVKSF